MRRIIALEHTLESVADRASIRRGCNRVKMPWRKQP
jgi:hypothetical protein